MQHILHKLHLFGTHVDVDFKENFQNVGFLIRKQNLSIFFAENIADCHESGSRF